MICFHSWYFDNAPRQSRETQCTNLRNVQKIQLAILSLYIYSLYGCLCGCESKCTYIRGRCFCVPNNSLFSKSATNHVCLCEFYTCMRHWIKVVWRLNCNGTPHRSNNSYTFTLKFGNATFPFINTTFQLAYTTHFFSTSTSI